MSRTHRTLVIGLRAGLAVGAAAAAVALVTAAATLPLPEHHAAIAPVDVQPSESGQQRVCPGPLLVLAEDSIDATASRSVGAAERTIAVDPDDADIDAFDLEAPANASATSDGGPVALLTAPDAVEQGRFAAAQTQSVQRETFAGLAAAACVEARADTWLVGGATDVGRTTLVLLANPNDVAATVDVRVVGEAGPIEAPSGLAIVVPPRTQRVVSLAGLAPNVVSPVVHVTANGGTVAATLQQSVIEGLEPTGVTYVQGTAAPAEQQYIPGFVVVGDDSHDAHDHVDGNEFAAVRLYAPGEASVEASVTLISSGGQPDAVVDVQVEAGEVLDVPLGAVRTGSYTIRVDASDALVAGARSTVERADAADEHTASDLVWHPSTDALLDDAAIAVPSGASAKLHLANPTENDADVVVNDGDAERSVTVPASGAVSLSVDDGAHMLTGARGLRAAVSLESADRVSGFGVQPPSPGDAPIDVYPR